MKITESTRMGQMAKDAIAPKPKTAWNPSKAEPHEVTRTIPLPAEAGGMVAKVAPVIEPAREKVPSAKPTEAGEKRQVSLYLREDQRRWLDEIELKIRMGTGWKVEHSPLIRGIVDAIRDSGIDLSGCRDEMDVVRVFRAALQR